MFQTVKESKVRYCSVACAKGEVRPKEHDEKRAANIGAASEYVVVAELLRRGWDVFRSVSPNAVVDLIALKGNRHVTIEVKTASGKTTTGALNYAEPRHERYDVLAVVLGQEVFFFSKVGSLL